MPDEKKNSTRDEKPKALVLRSADGQDPPSKTPRAETFQVLTVKVPVDADVRRALAAKGLTKKAAEKLLGEEAARAVDDWRIEGRAIVADEAAARKRAADKRKADAAKRKAEREAKRKAERIAKLKAKLAALEGRS